MATVAGHRFEQTPNGRRCTMFSTQKADICNCAWVDIRSCTEEDVGKVSGLAHAGFLTCSEVAEIRAEVEREEAAIWEAVVDAASSGSR